MKITKCVINYWIRLVALTIIGVFIFALYRQTPTERSFEIAAGPNEALAELLAIAEKGVPINPDPYASSTYQPDDVLYPAMALIQRRGYAEDLLSELAEQGNVDAMFWLGIVHNSGFYSGSKYFLQAAELGNPYAALMLDKDNPSCKRNCDAKWGELGRKILRERAAQGDAKAGYALYLNIQYQKPSLGYLFNRKEYEAKGQGPFQVLLKAAKDGIKQNYYKPLSTLLDLYTYRYALMPFNDNKVPLTKKEQAILFKVMEIAVNNNDIGVIAGLSSSPDGWRLNAADRVIDFVDETYRLFAYEAFSLMALKDRAYAIRGYARAITYQERYKGMGTVFNIGIYEDMLEDANVSLLSKKEKAQARLLADQYLKNYAPILDVDETRTR